MSLNFPLQIQNDQLQIMRMTIPLQDIRVCQINLQTNSVRVFCYSKDKQQSTLNFQLEKIENVQKCAQLLIARTNVAIVTKLQKSIEIENNLAHLFFNTEAEAQEFGTCYFSCFFPKREFESKLEGNRCIVICRNLENAQNRIIERINYLKRRIFGDPLCEPQPGDPEIFCLYRGKENQFIVSPQFVKRVDYSLNKLGQFEKEEVTVRDCMVDNVLGQFEKEIQTQNSSQPINGFNVIGSNLTEMEKMILTAAITKELSLKPLN